jgi:hypothetical protein
MSHPTITLHAFQQFISDHRDPGVIPNKPEATLRGQGEDSYQRIKNSISSLIDSWKKQIKSIGDSSAKKEALEAEMSEKLYKILCTLPMNVLTDSDFWRYLSCHPFFEFTEWRDGENCALASFGANANRVNFDCVPYRMFNRALVAFSISEDEDNFDYALVPGTDLWRSHILRVLNSYSSAMSQAILDKALAKELPTQILRETIKNLNRYRNNILFETLEYDEALALLELEIEKAKKKVKK